MLIHLSIFFGVNAGDAKVLGNGIATLELLMEKDLERSRTTVASRFRIKNPGVGSLGSVAAPLGVRRSTRPGGQALLEPLPVAQLIRAFLRWSG